MPNNVLRILSGGFRVGWYMPLDGDGYFAGATGSLTPGAALQTAYQLVGVKTAPYKAIEPLVLLGTGEDEPQGQLVEPPQTLPTFDIVGSVGDLTLDALSQQTAVVNIGNASVGVIQPRLPNYIDAALMFFRLALSKDNATNGSGNWDGVIFPKIKLVPMSSDGMSEKKITDFKRHVICNPSSMFPTGLAISTSNFLTSSGVEFPITSPNKLIPLAGKGDGVTTDFTIPQSSIPGYGLLVPGYPNVAYVEGVVVTPVVTLVGTTYHFAISPAPASNARIEIWAEYL